MGQREKREVERKNNIIIKGIKWKTEDLGEEVEIFMKEELEIDVEIKEVKKIGVKRRNSMMNSENGEMGREKRNHEKEKNLRRNLKNIRRRRPDEEKRNTTKIKRDKRRKSKRE